MMQDSTFKTELKQLEKAVRRRVRQDQRVFYDALVQDLGKAGELHDARNMYRLLTQLGGRKSTKTGGSTLPLLKKDGIPVATFADQQRLWMRQFADIEAANVMARSEYQRLLPSCIGLAPELVSVDAFPNVNEIVDRNSSHEARKGCRS